MCSAVVPVPFGSGELIYLIQSCSSLEGLNCGAEAHVWMRARTASISPYRAHSMSSDCASTKVRDDAVDRRSLYSSVVHSSGGGSFRLVGVVVVDFVVDFVVLDFFGVLFCCLDLVFDFFDVLLLFVAPFVCALCCGDMIVR